MHEVGGDPDRVRHASFRVTGVRVEAVKRGRQRVGRKALRLDLAAATAVHRVRAPGAELRDVEILRAAPDLFIGREGDAHTAVRNIGMRDEIGRRAHDFGDTGFVVGPEEGRPRGGHDIVAHLLGERRVLCQPQHGRRVVGQHEIAPVVPAMDDRPDVRAAHLRRCIDVRDEPDRRHAGLGRRGRNRRRQVAVLIEARVDEAQAAQLLRQVAEEDKLGGGARIVS